MKNKTNLQEELSRMKYLAGILSEAVVQQQPAQQQSAQQQQPVQQQQQQPTTNLDPAKVDQAMAQGMDAMIKNLPNLLKKFTTTVGDKDGQLDTGDEKPQAQQGAQANTQQAAQNKQVQEGGKKRELMFDEEKYNSECKDLQEGGLLGLVASTPAIMQMGGKLLQKMGSKTNPNFIQKFGKTVADAGEKLHHKYLGVIEKAISPFMPSATPEVKKKAAEAMFMVLVTGLFASGLSHPDLLSGVKGKEMADYVAQLMPSAMSSIGFA